MRRLQTWLGVAVVAVGCVAPRLAAAETREFTVVNIEFEGSKIWLPSTLHAKKGDVVKVKLINNVKSDPNQHGFAIKDFNVEKVVTRGEPATVEFTADKVGIFPITCQLHPAHIGGQLIVE